MSSVTLSGSIDALKFLRFITSSAARCSQNVNYKSIVENAYINRIQAKQWLNILEKLGDCLFASSVFKQCTKKDN